MRKINRDVAQLASAPRSGRGGRTFESSHPDFFSISRKKPAFLGAGAGIRKKT